MKKTVKDQSNQQVQPNKKEIIARKKQQKRNASQRIRNKQQKEKSRTQAQTKQKQIKFLEPKEKKIQDFYIIQKYSYAEYYQSINKMAAILKYKYISKYGRQFNEQQKRLYNLMIEKTMLLVFIEQLKNLTKGYAINIIEAILAYYYQFQKILMKKQQEIIYFQVHQDIEMQCKFRKMVIQNSVKSLILINYKDQRFSAISQNQCSQQVIHNKIKLLTYKSILKLTQLNIKKSFIYEHIAIENIANQTIAQILQSEFVIYIFTYYFNEMKQCYLKSVTQQISQETIKNILFLSKIYYIDDPDSKMKGVTLSKDNQLNYPIYINFYQFKTVYVSQEYGKQQQIYKRIKMYITIILLHELTHYLVRKLQLLSDNEDSNKWETKSDGGYRFEEFIFGQVMQTLTYKDYNQIIKKIIELKNINYQSYDFQKWNKLPKKQQQYKLTQKDKKNQIMSKNKIQIQQQKLQKKKQIKKYKDKVEIINKQLENMKNQTQTHQNLLKNMNLSQMKKQNQQQIINNQKSLHSENLLQKKQKQIQLKPITQQIVLLLDQLHKLGQKTQRSIKKQILLSNNQDMKIIQGFRREFQQNQLYVKITGQCQIQQLKLLKYLYE